MVFACVCLAIALILPPKLGRFGLGFHPSFFHRIINIVLFGSSKQMTWPDAAAMITTMKHTKSLWNRTHVNYVRNAVRPLFFLVPLKHSITTGFTALYFPCPFPAFSQMRHVLRDWTTFIHLLPKACFESFQRGVNERSLFRHSESFRLCLVALVGLYSLDQ